MDPKSDFPFYSLSSQLNSPEYRKRGELAVSTVSTSHNRLSGLLMILRLVRAEEREIRGFAPSVPGGRAFLNSSTPPPTKTSSSQSVFLTSQGQNQVKPTHSMPF